MLCVRTSVRPSGIHGLGVFADKDVSQGEVVWRCHELDRSIPIGYLGRVDALAAEFILHYGYINPDKPDFIILCFDNARYMNFAEPANTEVGEKCRLGEYVLRASRDIRAGEEITVSLDSDADASRKMQSTAHLRFNRRSTLSS